MPGISAHGRGVGLDSRHPCMHCSDVCNGLDKRNQTRHTRFPSHLSLGNACGQTGRGCVFPDISHVSGLQDALGDLLVVLTCRCSFSAVSTLNVFSIRAATRVCSQRYGSRCFACLFSVGHCLKSVAFHRRSLEIDAASDLLFELGSVSASIDASPPDAP